MMHGVSPFDPGLVDGDDALQVLTFIAMVSM
jgi:hypothetical protein